ncbi:MAG: hypothetical protein Q4D27_07540 [Coriobacteriia bacterium]|nr:hypothetical protein [Coriobacteriia bacterium]
MPALQVKECPDELYERLRECAARENRSIAQQTVTILEEYLGMRPAAKPAIPTMAHAPKAGRPRLMYSTENQGNIDYAADFREKLRLFDDLPPIPISKQCPRTDVILAQIREEEAR